MSSRVQKLYEDFKWSMVIASAALSLITTGVQAAVLTLISRRVDWSSLATLFMTTAPLTLAIALTAAIAWPDIAWRHSFFGCLMESVGAAALFLFLAIIIANYFGNLSVDLDNKVIPGENGGPMGVYFVVNTMYAYYRAYGVAAFWSSVVLGVCLGGVLRRI